MRKFKHKKTGWIVTEKRSIGNTQTYNGIETGNVAPDLVENSSDWEEIIEKPEYVKCITDISNTSYILNKIYKVDEDTDFVIGERSSVARWNNKFISGSKFEPSTKEAYDEQNKPQLTLSVWCKAIYGYNNFNYYKAVSQSRGESIHSVCWGKGTYCDNDGWSTEFKLVEVLTDLTEIQVYLPDNHVDKIKPKLDYEILSFTSQYPDVKEVCFKHDNGKFGRNWGQRSEHEMLIEVSKNIRKIHSIKRLSDDEIFTIGDKIYYTDGDFKHDHCSIDDLTIIDNKIYVNHHYKGNPNRFINEWIKVIHEPIKPVLFTTHDGVDITQGDINIYFCRNNSSFKVSMLIQSSKVNNLAEYYYFSTKEACQAYIDSFVPKIKEEPKTDLITVQLTKEKYDLLMQLLEE